VAAGEFLSPTDLIARAIVLSALLGIAHLAGLREHTTFLSGTLADPAMGWGWAAFLGGIYLVLYFAFVLLVPVLLLAAVASAAVHRVLGAAADDGHRVSEMIIHRNSQACYVHHRSWESPGARPRAREVTESRLGCAQ